MSRFRKALPTSRRRGFKMLHHLYYYCSTVLILDAFQDKRNRSAPRRVPASPRLLTPAAPPRAPPPAPPPPPRPHAAPRPLLPPRQGSRAPREPPPPAQANQQSLGGRSQRAQSSYLGTNWSGRRRSRSRAPHPPPSFSSTLPSEKTAVGPRLSPTAGGKRRGEEPGN